MIREPVTLIVTGARLWSGRVLPEADALAVAGERIVAIGRTADVLALADAHTRLIDARGATVTPGLTDAHVHLLPWALSLGVPDLHGARSRDDVLARVAAGREGALRSGRGWDAAGWPEPPHRDVIDDAYPDVPAILHSHDFHALWVNTAALRAAGVGEGVADPPGGRFERDARGRLTGVVRETAVRPLLELEARLGPAPGDARLAEAAAALHARGITAVHDFNRDAETFRWTSRLARARKLRVLQQVGPEQLDGLIAAGVASGTGDDWFRVGGLKLFADGTLGSRTASMLEPFDDRGGLGMDVTPPAELDALVARAFAAGVSVAIHAIGDRALRHALDAIERAGPGAAPLAIPPRVEHVQLAHPDDLARFARLGVVASMQPQHCVTDIPAARAAWGARCPRSYPWRALLTAGTTLVFGSDAPVEPPEVSEGLAAALTRRAAGTGPGEGFETEQCLDLDEALRAYTAEPAAVAGEGSRLGELHVGRVADLVVWERPLHAVAPESLRAARPVVTVLAGEIVYLSPEQIPAGTGTHPAAR